MNEIFYPFMMTVVICTIKIVTEPTTEVYDAQPTVPAVPITMVGNPIIEQSLVYGPCTDPDGYMGNLTQMLYRDSNGRINVTAHHVDDQATLMSRFEQNPLDFWAGVWFDSSNPGFPCNFSDPNIYYTILMKEFNPYDPLPIAAIPGNSEDGRKSLMKDGDATCRGDWLHRADNATACPAGLYITSGFAALETYMDQIIEISRRRPELRILWQQAAKDSFTVPSDSVLSPIAVMMIIMGYAPLVQFLMVNLVTEKEKGIKEAMYLMGMNMKSYWGSWFITYTIMMMVPCTLITIITNKMDLFANSNPVCIFLILFLFGLSLVAFAMMLAPMFKVAKTAGLAGMLSTTIVSVGVFGLKNVESVSIRVALSLLSPLAAALALQTTLEEEPYGGLTFSNFGSIGAGFSPRAACGMMLVDIFIYLLACWVIDGIVSGTGSFRTLKSPKHKTETGLSIQSDQVSLVQADDRSFEHVQGIGESDFAISVNQVSKQYKGTAKEQRKFALDSVSFDMYSDQIFALLGHNGAGKSTLHRIITGLLLPSSGRVTIFGHDITTASGRNNVRKIMGVCPQHDILYDTLTVAEHLELFGLIKGVAASDLRQAVSVAVEEVHLKDQKDVASTNLSGGQQRKLSVAIALIGDPSVVCLDEPTSGMDPYSRRQLWDLLQAKRKGRVILFTTHQMDEADILADRKTILSGGRLRCLGSSLFLKSRFGVGYHLHIIQNGAGSEAELVDVVKQSVLPDTVEITPMPNLSTASGDMRQTKFSLRIDSVPKFPRLFAALKEPTLRINDYGISMTTLEEVFLKLAGEGEDGGKGENRTYEDDLAFKPNASPTNGIYEGDVRNRPESDANVELPSWGQQLKSLMRIKAVQSFRSKLMFTFQIVLPCVMLIIGLAGVLKPSKAGNDLQRLSFGAETHISEVPVYAEPRCDMCVQFRSALFLQNHIVGVNPRAVASSSSILNPTDLDPAFSAGLLVMPSSDGGVSVTVVFNSSTVGVLPWVLGPVTAAYRHASRNSSSNHSHDGTQNAGETRAQIIRSSQPLSFEPSVPFDSNSFNAILFVGIALSVIPGNFAVDIVRERKQNTKHQLFASGVPASAYYGAHFFASIILMSIPCITALILAQAVNVKPLIGPAFFATSLTIVLYIPMTILLAFTASFGFVEPDNCHQLTAILNMAAFMPFIAVGVTDGLGPSYKDTVVMMHYIFCVLDPPYTLLGAFYFIFRVDMVTKIEPGSDASAVSDYFLLDNNISQTLLIMFVQMCLFGGAVYALENGTFTALKQNFYSLKRTTKAKTSYLPLSVSSESGGVGLEEHEMQDSDSEDIDDDVTAAKARVESSIEDDDLIAILSLKKSFKRKSGIKRAVKGLSFAVKRGEVFGLLGPNGAGKTTSMSMLTGAQQVGHGDALIGSHSIKTELTSALRLTGYCPQFSALFPLITVSEHLLLFARLRGYHQSIAIDKANEYMKLMGITQYKNTRAANLSGGTQRKLSVAISLIGNPVAVLLDEPSTGMDPATRKFLWSIIQKHCRSRATVLTTHSMEEAEALCSTIGIMVDGRLRCIGSSQHLKAKFGQDFTLEVKADPSKAEDLRALITKTFDSVVPMEVYTGHYVYRVRGAIGVGEVFELLQESKDALGIEEFSYSQPTLEQVFLGFAKEQIALDLESTA